MLSAKDALVALAALAIGVSMLAAARRPAAPLGAGRVAVADQGGRR